MLDFDDSSAYWYVADIIYALRDTGGFNIKHPIISRFIDGYKSETKLEKEFEVLKNASGFERLHKLISFAKLIRTVDIEESRDLPEWLVNLRKKICGVIDNYRLSFEDEQNR